MVKVSEDERETERETKRGRKRHNALLNWYLKEGHQSEVLNQVSENNPLLQFEIWMVI